MTTTLNVNPLTLREALGVAEKKVYQERLDVRRAAWFKLDAESTELAEKVLKALPDNIVRMELGREWDEVLGATTTVRSWAIAKIWEFVRQNDIKGLQIVLNQDNKVHHTSLVYVLPGVKIQFGSADVPVIPPIPS